MSQPRGGNLISSAQLTYAQKVKKGNTPPQSKQAQQQQQQQQQQSQQPRSQPPPQQASQRESQQRSATQAQRASSRQTGNQRVPSRQRQAVQAQHAQQQQVRMLPVHQQTAHLFATPTIQQYTYPYNYTNLQQQMSRGGYGAQPYYPRHAPQPQARAPPPYGGAGGGGGGAAGQQRNFFDRKVQSNVTTAVNEYYNYPQHRQRGGPPAQAQQAQPQQQQQQQQQQQAEQAGPRDAQQRQQKPYNNPTYSSSRFRDTNTRYNNRRSRQYSGYSGGGGYSGNNTNFQRPPYQSSTRPGYARNRNDGRSSSARYKRRGNFKPTESQLRTYEAAADRDVLCWIYENQGRCRYGEKCQWLHLDRETGQYVPTVYIMNSLESTQYRGKENQPSSSSTGDRKEEQAPNDGDDDKKQADNEEEPAAGGGGGGDDGDKAEKVEKDLSPEELSKKFQILMAKSIQQKIDEKEKKVDQNEEDNKQAADKKEEEEDEKDDAKKGQDSKADKKEASDEEEDDDDDDGEDGGDKDKDKKKKDGQKYGTYGTTFDKQNVCWEFNTFVGCRKGTKCKWAHQYLIAPNAVHPYTGEKLNGLAVRKFRIANNL